MKNKIVNTAFAILLIFGCANLMGCNENSSTNSETHENHEHTNYQCPMDCEEGKTYEEEGKCPVCNMDLVEV